MSSTTGMNDVEFKVVLRRSHGEQHIFIESSAKRKVIRAGRRSGKTTGVATLSLKKFLAGRRILYATPTAEQVDRFWFEVKRALAEPLDAGVLYKHEGRHIIEIPDTETRIRAKTAWDANTLRGDYADLLILDEWQLMNEDAWDRVGAPMLLDNDGDAIFVYTPPSLHSRGRTKARDPRHTAKMFKRAKADKSGRWAAFHFTSRDNPHISAAAIDDLAHDMTALAYRQEIMAEDVDDAPGALWARATIEKYRVLQHPDLERIVVGVDPPGGATECGIVVGGVAFVNGQKHGYVLADDSSRASPNVWARAVITAYHRHKADRIVAEANFGGDMVENTIRTVEPDISYKAVNASRGKAIRAEPVAALYEQGRIHHVGEFSFLEDELCTWEPGVGARSPNRLDALVWAMTEVGLGSQWLIY